MPCAAGSVSDREEALSPDKAQQPPPPQPRTPTERKRKRKSQAAADDTAASQPKRPENKSNKPINEYFRGPAGGGAPRGAGAAAGPPVPAVRSGSMPGHASLAATLPPPPHRFSAVRGAPLPPPPTPRHCRVRKYGAEGAADSGVSRGRAARDGWWRVLRSGGLNCLAKFEQSLESRRYYHEICERIVHTQRPGGYY